MKHLNSIFVNRTLNMRKIRSIGFDMDHTIVRYNIPQVEQTIYEKIMKKLVEKKNYPKEILNLSFNAHHIIRGLVIDTRYGNFLKLSRYRSIRTIYHGETQIDYTKRKEMYSNNYIHFGIDQPDFCFIESHFQIAWASAFMKLIEFKKTNSSLPEYKQIFLDIESFLNDVHSEKGGIKDCIMENPEKYIKLNPHIAPALEKFIQYGKILFLLTNSPPEYCFFLMNYTITPFLKKYSSWTDVFNIIITSADKPHFFHQKRDFQKLENQTFKIQSHTKIPNSGLYQQGSAEGLTQALKIKEDEILFIGDQVYTDVVLLKQKCGWRTALVIEELEQERKTLKANKSLYNDIQKFMEKKIPMEIQVNEMISDQIENNHKKYKIKIKSMMKEIENLDQQLADRIKKINQSFNPLWGELMREGFEESLFASQAERFACIYMSFLIDFLSTSPRTYFRAQKRPFPHEIE